MVGVGWEGDGGGGEREKIMVVGRERSALEVEETLLSVFVY